jgi:hypothetical protein
MMNQLDCEAVQVAAMALADGETPLLTEQQVRAHTQGCSTCRDEAAHSQRSVLPVGARRTTHAADLWSAIENQLAVRVPQTQGTSGLRRDARVWLALAAAVLLMTGGPTWMYLNQDGRRPAPVTPTATPSPKEAIARIYAIPLDPPEHVDEGEFRKKFALYFGDEFQRQQAERLGDDVDVNLLRTVAIDGPEGPVGTLFIDRAGEVALAIKQPWVLPFHEGLAAVGTKVDEALGNRLTHFGFIDRTGQLAIPAEYEYAEQFSEGLAAVKQDGKYGYIDKRGKMVIEPQYRLGEPFQDGIARVTLMDGDSRVHFIDRGGKVLLSGNVWDEGKFSEGLLCVNWPGQQGFDSGRARGYVDRNFEFVFRLGEDSSGFWPLRCEEFHDGMAAVEIGASNQWSFIDREGKLAARGPFKQIQPFSEGRAAVALSHELAALWGYIDRHGDFIIEPKYFGARSYTEGLAAVLLPLEEAADPPPDEPAAKKLPQVKWGYIDVAGRTRIPPRFYRAEPFENGLAQVSENPLHIGFIDKTGKYVWQMTQPSYGREVGVE